MKRGIAFISIFLMLGVTISICAEAQPESAGVVTGADSSVSVETPGEYLESPFGVHPADAHNVDYEQDPFADAVDIGVRWTRPMIYAFWFLTQPEIDGEYDVSTYDDQFGSVPQGINILANISPGIPGLPPGVNPPGNPTMYNQDHSYIPTDEAKYADFVKAVVERYDGDGIDDMPGLLNPIRYWQVDNEPNSVRFTGYPQLVKITYEAVKEACPEAQVIMGGTFGFPPNYNENFDIAYAPWLEELNGNYVDIFDMHWYGAAGGDYRFIDPVTGEDALIHVRETLTANGFSEDIPMWITEMGCYSGTPKKGPFAPASLGQTERQQSEDLFRRYIYSISRGIDKVFLAFGLLEGFKYDDMYFDHTGLIYEGFGSDDLGLGVKKLSYYTYKKMTQELEGCDWSTIKTVSNGIDNLYLYSVTQDDKLVYIGWWDYFDENTASETKKMVINDIKGSSATIFPVIPSVEKGSDVKNFYTAFEEYDVQINNGVLEIEIDHNPVIIRGN